MTKCRAESLSLASGEVKHNLVIGAFNRFTQASYGGLVVGNSNTISSAWVTVTGGIENLASWNGANVTGGNENTAAGLDSVVIGGSGITDTKPMPISPAAPLNHP
jgi:hypothetical protein